MKTATRRDTCSRGDAFKGACGRYEWLGPFLPTRLLRRRGCAAAYRLLAPGSEWHLHLERFQRSALADLLGEDTGLAEIPKLYRCHDRLLVHKQAVFDGGRW